MGRMSELHTIMHALAEGEPVTENDRGMVLAWLDGEVQDSTDVRHRAAALEAAVRHAIQQLTEVEANGPRSQELVLPIRLELVREVTAFSGLPPAPGG